MEEDYSQKLEQLRADIRIGLKSGERPVLDGIHAQEIAAPAIGGMNLPVGDSTSIEVRPGMETLANATTTSSHPAQACADRVGPP